MQMDSIEDHGLPDNPLEIKTIYCQDGGQTPQENNMSKGQCLCGSVTWAFFGQPESAYHCHCQMCRKAHGAAYGTYYYMIKENFCWTSGRDTIRHYRSSPTLTRSFCQTCGSVTPNADDIGQFADHTGQFMFVPAGSHDDGPEITANIFVASKAPWHDITDNLPKHDRHPPVVLGLIAYNNPPLSAPTPGIARGSCLCGEVRFEVTLPFKMVHNCYCSRCRQERAAAFTTNGFTAKDAVRFTQGSDCLTSYKLPSAKYFTHVFCKKCGSGLPRVDAGRDIAVIPCRDIAVIPLGALDDDPGCKADDNIFVANKANWSELDPNLPSYDQYPPRK